MLRVSHLILEALKTLRVALLGNKLVYLMSGGKWKENQNFLAAAVFLAQLFSYTLCIS